jgi:hypothetical protein
VSHQAGVLPEEQGYVFGDEAAWEEWEFTEILFRCEDLLQEWHRTFSALNHPGLEDDTAEKSSAIFQTVSEGAFPELRV